MSTNQIRLIRVLEQNGSSSVGHSGHQVEQCEQDDPDEIDHGQRSRHHPDEGAELPLLRLGCGGKTQQGRSQDPLPRHTGRRGRPG